MKPHYVSLKLDGELKQLIDDEARKRSLPLNECIAQILAAFVKRDDLGYVPRSYRRRTKEEMAAAE